MHWLFILKPSWLASCFGFLNYFGALNPWISRFSWLATWLWFNFSVLARLYVLGFFRCLTCWTLDFRGFHAFAGSLTFDGFIKRHDSLTKLGFTRL